MKKFFKKFAKTVGYALVYILVALGSAVGILFLSPAGGGGGEDELYIAPQLTQVYQNFTTVKALKVVELKVDIETPTDDFTIILNADVDLNGGLEKLGVDGTLSVLIDDQQLDIDIRYTDGVVYIDVLNGKYMIETSNIMESINQILSILNIEMPDLGMSLGSLDLDSILAMLSDLTEIKGENNITLSINVPVIGSLSLVCDLNYSVRELNLPKTEISEGTTISVASKFDYPSSVTVDTPTEPEYINATHLFTVLGSALDYLNQEEIGFDIDAQYSDYSFAGNFSASIKEFNSKFTTNILGYDLNLVAIDNILYFEYGNLNLKFALADANLLSSLLYEQFGLDLPLDEIISILTSLKNGNLMEIIPSLNFGESKGRTNLSDIDLSIIQSFIKNGDVYTLTLRDIGEINFGVKENKLVSLGFTGFGADALLSMVSPRKVSLTSDNYLDLKDTLPTLNALISTIKQNSFVGSAVILNKEEAIGSMSYAINKNNLAAHVEISVYGQVISLDLLGSTIYLKIKDMGVYLSIEDADSIKSFLSDNFNIAMEGFDLNKFIDQVLEILNPNINPSFIKSMTKTENGLTITVFNDLTISIDYADTISSMAISFGDIKANLTLTASQEDAILPSINEGDYQPLDTLLNAITETKKYIENKQFYLSFDLNYDKYFASGSANYDESGISAYASANIDGNNIELRFIDETIYLDISGLKISFALSDIDTVSNFVYEKFGFDINKMINDVKNKLQNTSTGDFNLQEFITNLNIVLNATSLDIVSPDFSLTLKFQDMLKGLSVNASGLTLNANIESKPSVIETTGEYFNITEILPFIDIVMKSVETKQFDLTAEAKVYEDENVIFETEDAKLQIDFTNALKLYGNVSVVGKTNHAMELSIYEDYLYANYNGLLLKIKTADLMDLISSVTGIFTPKTTGAGEGTANSGFSLASITSTLGSLLPNLNLNNPISLIQYVKSISSKNNTLSIVIDGRAISTNERAENMIIELGTDGEKLTRLKLVNFYTGVSNEEHFDLDIQFNTFNTETGVKAPDTTQNYVDISGSNELIKAALNMIKYRDFEISGKVNINMTVPVVKDIKLSIPVTIKAKIVEGKFKLFIALEEIPVIHYMYNLNNDTNWSSGKVNNLSDLITMKISGQNRALYIYYEDGDVYFYRHETNKDGETYEKKLKAPMAAVTSDILYYVQWGTGFNDDIIGAIRKSLANKPDQINLGKLFAKDGFRYDPVTKIGTVIIDMETISGDPMMGDMTIGLRITDHNITADEKESTEQVIGLLDFGINMPFADGVELTMATAQDSPLTINLDKEVDFSDFYNKHVNGYPFADNVEYDSYGGGDWIQGAEREFSVDFVTNQPHLSETAITGKHGTTFTLPQYTTTEYKTETDYTFYEFVGWYSSSDFAENTCVTEGVVAKYNMTLYAKWNALERKRTVTFYDHNGNLISSQFAEVDTALANVANEFIYEEQGDKLITKRFSGWYGEDGYPRTRIPEKSMKLYARYEQDDSLTKTKHTLTIDSGIAKAVDPVEVFYSLSTAPYIPNYDSAIDLDEKTYVFDGWYLDAAFTTEFDGIMPDYDLTIYAKWMEAKGYTLTIIDNGTPYTKTIVPGRAVTLPAGVKYEKGVTEFYDNQEFSGSPIALNETMPENDLTLFVRNQYTITITYYEQVNGIHTEKTFSDKRYQGETLVLPAQSNYEIDYDTDSNGEKDKLIAYFFDGYTLDGNKVTGSVTALNRDISIAANMTTQESAWCKMSFHFEWVKPQGSPNTWTKKTVETQDYSIFVLAGATLNGINLTYTTSLLNPTEYTRELSASCNGKLGITYHYHAIGYNNTECVNYGLNNGTAKSMTVTKSDTFYVEWDD